MTIGPKLLYATVFVSGMTTLGIELTATRLLGSFFGGSNLVWANIIGLMLLYLTAGYYLGGRWADRSPKAETLFTLLLWAAFFSALMPFIAHPLLQLAARALADIEGALAIGSFFVVLLLFALPVTLLGCVSPFAIRLAIRDLARAGHLVGNIYAISTLGSLLGTFLPVLFLIPRLGTLRSFLCFAAILYALAFYGLWRSSGGRHTSRWLWMPALIALLTTLRLSGPLRPAPIGLSLLHETESPYHYLQVLEHSDGTRYLHLNEGQGVHSVWHPQQRYFDGSWDFFLAAPYFNRPPYSPARVRSLLIIGLAAGTIARQHQGIYGDIPMKGVELDGEIIRLGAKYFGMNAQHLPSLQIIEQEGRFSLRQIHERYSVIAIDAYRPPYIPWQLTTKEFFAEARSRLTGDGVLAINIGRTPSDRRLVDALSQTLQQVFPSVHAIDVPASFNTILVATVQDTAGANLTINANALSEDAPPTLRRILTLAIESQAPIAPSNLIFSDDHAPVETLVDSLVLRFLLSDELNLIRP